MTAVLAERSTAAELMDDAGLGAAEYARCLRDLARVNRVTFTPLDAVPPGQTLTYLVQVEAAQAGDARFRAELTTATLRQPVVKEESTTVR